MDLNNQILSYFKQLFDELNKFNLTYPKTSKFINLTFIYFFALIDLTYGILTQILAVGYVPENVMPFLGQVQQLLNSSLFKIWSSPEKIFLLSYVTIELMVVRRVLGFSKLIKYNILLVFAILMVQGVVLSFWDLLFNRSIANLVEGSIDAENSAPALSRIIATVVFSLTFFSFIFLYAYFYYKAMNNKIGTLKNFEWLTDSVCFWLKIKTPTMNFWHKGKKKEQE